MGVYEEAQAFWTSKSNLRWIKIAILVLVIHLAIKYHFPAFVPPATPDNPRWMRVLLFGELYVLHLGFLGTLLGEIVNRWSRASDSDDETLSIGSTQVASRETTRWGEVVGIVIEFTIYLAAWAWVYRIL
jgi:hypothetical protein